MEDQLQFHHQIMDRRHDALGVLRVLPDEIICGILEEYFSPLDLARLSCVSSVLYILCNEEPPWMRLCLKQGGQLQYKGSWKKTTLYRQNLCNAIELSREKPLQFYGFNSLFLYRRWYRCYTTLSNFNFDTGHLEKRKNLSLEEFCSQYDGRKPILLTELAENWPARVKWTKDQLALSHGDVAFRISQRSSKKILMTFKDYVSYMEHQNDEDPLYIFDDKFGEVAPSLLEDYNVPHLFQEDFFDVLDHDQRPPFRWLIIGPERSGASWHVDPALTSAWNTLLFGRKRWALYPPGRVPAGVTVHVNEDDGDVNIDGPTSLQWWLDVYPHLAECDKPIECTQLPGETIYVPSGWWHCVLNLEITVAVTQNYVNQSNFGYTCLDMTPGHRHKGVCRAGLLAVNDEALISMSRNYPNLNRKEKRLKVLSGENKPCRSDKNWKVWNNMENVEFSYDVDFISNFLEPERDHYTSVWCPSNCIGPREMRQWLHKLWIMKPEMRPLTWKGACLALNVDRWLTCARQICTFHNLPFPNLDEQFPVGTGSNPVFLFSDYVIKICTEGGLESSLHSLGTELQLYDLLHKVKSPLLNHIPEVVCSGLLVNKNGSCKPVSWNGRELPNVVANSEFVKGGYSSEDFQFGIWRKMNFGVQNTDSNPHSTIWPYVVTKRCKGDIFANIRDVLKENEILHLASFLGEQLRNIHLLPLPPLVDGPDKPAAENVPSISNGLHFSKEWEPVIAILNGRRRNLKDRLSQWGDPIPEFLIEKVEEYIPHNLASLFNLSKSGEDEHGGFPTWIHSDIMDDNIHLESNTNSPDNCFNATVNLCNGGETQNYWLPTHILDFSNLTIGDPLYDIIPIYLDIFRGDSYLLKKLIESYKLPLERTQNHVPTEKVKKFARTSYRAMCFCILHEDNILGAIFSLWKDLKQADSWEKVEEAVWGILNNYEGSDQRF